MMPTSYKPMKNKIDALLKMSAPSNQKQVRSFLGAINFYKSKWPRHTHVFAPLTMLTQHDPFNWDPACQQTFNKMKAVLAIDCLNMCADLNKSFTIICNASDYQLGSCILQEGRTVAYWSKSLSPTQNNYTTTENELLAIVLTLKEYRRMLFGGKLVIYTDHKNLTLRTLSTQQGLRWRLYMDDFDFELNYLEGEKNVIADCFSRLPRMDKISVGDKELKMIQKK